MPLTIEQMRRNVKTGYKPPSELARKAAKAKTPIINPKSSVRGKVLDQAEIRKQQSTKRKKPSKGATGYSGVNRI